MKLLRWKYLPKVLIALGLLLQFLIVFGLLLFLSTKISSDPQEMGRQARYIYYSLAFLFVVDLILAFIIINTDSPEVYKITWLFFVFALPILGALLYLFIANKQTARSLRRKVKKYMSPIQNVPLKEEDKKAIEQRYPYYEGLTSYLLATSKGAVHQKTSVRYFGLTDDAFEPILEELKKAKHYIFLEFFILAEGKFWGSILEILKQKAKEGLDVRVLYDDVGSISTVPFRYDRILESYGIKAVCFNPFRPFLDIRMNNRDHRKIMVIDGHTCFTGGFNIADEYINAIVRFGHWKDNAMLLKGDAVTNFTAMFLANWNVRYKEKEEIDKEYYDASHFIDEIGGFPQGEGFVQPYTDIPFDKNAVGQQVYVSLCTLAKRYLYIATPYLIINQEMLDALCYAAKKGVDVRLLTPHIPDKPTVFGLTRSYYGPLIKAGVKVYEYTPGFVHEKVFISDDEIATCGTINLDYRSLYLHMECGTLVIGDSAVVDMKEDYLKTLDVCHEVRYEEWEHWHTRNKTYWAALRLIAPLL